jgi:hypothetical protein
MNSILNNDLETLDTILSQVKQQGHSYLQRLLGRSTTSHHKASLTSILNADGLGTVQTLQQFNERFEAIMVASSGPRFWGFVTGGTTPASIAGDWLASIYDQNPHGMITTEMSLHS